jgi:hypothetical protein
MIDATEKIQHRRQALKTIAAAAMLFQPARERPPMPVRTRRLEQLSSNCEK